MRSILSISLPADLLALIRKKAQKAGLSMSAYVRRLIENEDLLISEEEILEMAKEAQADYKAGRYKVWKNHDDIDEAFSV